MYDIGIIGGGTAGLTAAIYGQRAGKKTIVFEGTNFGGQIASSPEVENYPGIAKISGAEFSMKLMEQAVNLGAETVMEQVTGVRDSNGMKVIETAGTDYACKSLILGGRRDAPASRTGTRRTACRFRDFLLCDL